MLHPDVVSMLRAHGISGPETELAHDGFSGARISAIAHDHERYVLKRLRREDDWIMRVSGDDTGREAQFAASALLSRVDALIRVPSIGASRDGAGWAVLMHDIAHLLVPDHVALSQDELDYLLSRLAAMHAAFWEEPLADAGISWCGVTQRLSILSPDTGRLHVLENRDFGIERGWRLFVELAPEAAVRLVRGLRSDMSPLLAIVDELPRTLLHGDVKFSNIGLAADEVHLFDWAVIMNAPVALEIAWIPGVNARRVPDPFAVIDLYGAHLERAIGVARFGEAAWPRQRAVAHIGALLLLGWAKALDADGGQPEELRYWSDAAIDGAKMLGLA